MIVAVTGQMRSGTAAVAGALHRMGIPVAIHTPAPMPPTWRFDWEDSKLSVRLLDEAKGEWFVGYLTERLAHAARCFNTEHLAVKSPYLAFHKTELELAAELLELPVKWIILSREQQAIDVSMSQWPVLDPKMNQQIQTVLSESRWHGALRVQYERLVKNPRSGIRALIRFLGAAVDPEDVQGAIETIQQPTTKAYV